MSTPESPAADGGSSAPSGGAPGPRLVRLNKVLAERGVGSRRRCDEIILAGGVTVDGRPVRELGARVDPSTARIEIEGRPLAAAHHVVYALHKPAGVVCTNAPEERRPRAIDLVHDKHHTRLFCVGRLDEDSEGLILLTNDGDLANRIAHPRYGVPKTYFVKVRGRLTPEAIAQASKGVWLAEGRTAGARVFVRKKLSNATVLLITIREGMNREIRRVFAKLQFPVEQLKRVAIGPVSLRGIHLGESRRLTPEEIEGLLKIGRDAQARPPASRTESSPRPRRGTQPPRGSRPPWRGESPKGERRFGARGARRGS